MASDQLKLGIGRDVCCTVIENTQYIFGSNL